MAKVSIHNLEKATRPFLASPLEVDMGKAGKTVTIKYVIMGGKHRAFEAYQGSKLIGRYSWGGGMATNDNEDRAWKEIVRDLNRYYNSNL